MAQININIRMDEDLKQKFDAMCKELGLNMTTAFTVFAKAVVRQQGIPFEISKYPNAEMLAAMQETEQILSEYNNGIRVPKHFSSAREMFAAMDAEDEAEG